MNNFSTYFYKMIFPIIVVGIICLLLGFLISNSIKTTKIREKNQEIEKEEQTAQLRIKDLEKEYVVKQNELENNYKEKTELYESNLRIQEQELENAVARKQAEIDGYRNEWEKEKNQKLSNWLQQESDLKSQISSLDTQIEEKQKSIQELDSQAKTAIKLVEEQVIDNMTTNVEIQNQELYSTYEKLESELKVHYTDLADELYDNFQQDDERLSNLILQKENELHELISKVNSIIEVNKRAELEKEQRDFYRLQLSDTDIEEIKRIRSIEPYLRKTEPLNKVIWKVYYEKPYTDLVGRVVGQNRKTGIYKITNINNGKVYVGQATDIAERFRQHIKRGIGADPPTQNKLYPAMLKDGVENFTFEIIEECPATKLTEREKYYTDIFEAQSFGYVVRKG